VPQLYRFDGDGDGDGDDGGDDGRPVTPGSTP
jgi:hypothetical protein